MTHLFIKHMPPGALRTVQCCHMMEYNSFTPIIFVGFLKRNECVCVCVCVYVCVCVCVFVCRDEGGEIHRCDNIVVMHISTSVSDHDYFQIRKSKTRGTLLHAVFTIFCLWYNLTSVNGTSTVISLDTSCYHGYNSCPLKVPVSQQLGCICCN